MKYIKIFLLTILAITSVSSLPGQESETGKNPFEYQVSYIGDNLNNLSGGVKTGSSYLGLANIIIGFNTGKAGLWRGGQFFINAANTHGGQPSGKLVGDLQIASNIEAGNHTYIQELWYRQTIGKFEGTIGLQNLNNDFANTKFGALYLNSSFGIPSTISTNLQAPIFPLTSVGLTIKCQTSDKTSWLAALYDGRPTDFAQNNHNLNWRLQSEDGIMAISEFQYSKETGQGLRILKVGFYSHNKWFHNNSGRDTIEPHVDNSGIYFITDRDLWTKPGGNRNLSMFTQAGTNFGPVSRNEIYIGMGLNYRGFLNKEGEDEIGVAIAHAVMKQRIGNETTLELTYKIPVMKKFFLQPDIQYIINPAGVDEQLSNCLLTNVRFGINIK